MTLIASTEPWERFTACPPDDALAAELDRRRRLVAAGRPGRPAPGFGAELVLAADQFIITPAGRVARRRPGPRRRATRPRTVIAGYHWFTDWGRDTMISLEGLTLATGRHAEAGYILRTFAHHVRDGLIPNFFPDERERGALPHRRRDALVLPRPRPLRRSSPATGTRCGAAADAQGHRRPPPARARASASASTRPTACCSRGPRATSSPGWTRRSATGWSPRGAARRWRSTPCGTTPCGCSRAGCARIGRRRRRDGSAGTPTGPRASFNRRFWNAGRRLPVRRGRRPRRATTRRCRPEPGVRDLAATTRCWTATRWQPVLDGGRGEAADAGRPAVAGPGQPGLQAAVLRRPARPATRPTTRGRSGRG